MYVYIVVVILCQSTDNTKKSARSKRSKGSERSKVAIGNLKSSRWSVVAICAQNGHILGGSFCPLCRRAMFVHRRNGFARVCKTTAPVQKVENRRACAQDLHRPL